MPDQNDIEAKKDALIWSAKRCFDLRLQTNAGGNLSVRLSSAEAIVIKPSGVGFNECTRDNLQIVHLDGTVEPSPFKPSKDLDFHLDLYRIRPDINAIVHCHSPWATGYASAGLEIPCLTVQTIEKIGRMPLIPLSPNGGPQTEAEISPAFRDPKVMAAVLANHGTIGVGPTLTKAQYLAEIIEAYRLRPRPRRSPLCPATR
jgi:ribulose-5-phosphate 4-epimerase/fuculose-1-phosphate aldolase